MVFFKREHIFRRFSLPANERGYSYFPYKDITLMADVQTMSDDVVTTLDGSASVQRLRVFCDDEIFIENQHIRQKADRLWFQNKWFECRSSRLSENTMLKHWTATFVELPDEIDPPELMREEQPETGVDSDVEPEQNNTLEEKENNNESDKA